jgi:Fe-S cluster assembly scaffold protein SufB
LSVPPLKVPFLTEERARQISESLGEPDWLLAERLDAVARVESLPAESNQLFTPYLDLRTVRFAEVDPYADAAGSAGRPVSTSALDGASALLSMDESGIVERVLSPEAAAAGVVIDSFAHVLAHRPEILREWIGDGASLPESDAFAQVARAGFSLGVVVHIPDGVRLEQPIVLRSTIGAAGRGLISRTVIALGVDAHASILEEQLPSAEADPEAADAKAPQSLWWGTSEVILGEQATLDVASIQDFGPTTVAIVNRDARLGREAHLRWSLASIGSLFHKSRIDNRLDGRGSSVRQVEIGFGSGAQIFDLTSYTRHIGQDTTGDLLSKGVFLDRSRGYIKGLIEINKSAKGTDSFLGEFSMLLDRKARSVTIPSLEIDQPDVRRAAHASSAGPIDETQVFYLMSRGIDRETARKFIVLGFLEPVVARVQLESAQDRLRQLLEAKWPAVARSTAGDEATAA